METPRRAVPVGSHLALTPGRLRGPKRETGGRCATPRCERPALADGLFCEPCGERLARVRAGLESDFNRPGTGVEGQRPESGRRGSSPPG
jgi:hypothetical protein